jgi:HSP20 family protein
MKTVTHWDGVELLGDLVSWLNPGIDDRPVRVVETDEGDRHVIRVDLPSTDPEKDVEVTLEDGILRLGGSCRAADDGPIRSFERFVSCPAGTRADEVTAEYADGVLSVSVPITGPVAPQAIPVTHRGVPVG